MSSTESEEIVCISSTTKKIDKQEECCDSSEIEIEPIEQIKEPVRRRRSVTNTRIKKPKVINKAKIPTVQPQIETKTELVPVTTPEPTDINLPPTSENTSCYQPVTVEETIKEKQNLSGEDKLRIIFKDGSREKVYFFRKEETLEAISNDLSPGAKIKYKGMFVSKFLSFEDLDCTEENNVFEIIGNTNHSFDIKINLDSTKTISLTVEKNLKVEDLFQLFTHLEGKENLLVINGYLLENSMLIEQILEDGDVLDYV